MRSNCTFVSLFTPPPSPRWCSYVFTSDLRTFSHCDSARWANLKVNHFQLSTQLAQLGSDSHFCFYRRRRSDVKPRASALPSLVIKREVWWRHTHSNFSFCFCYCCYHSRVRYKEKNKSYLPNSSRAWQTAEILTSIRLLPLLSSPLKIEQEAHCDIFWYIFI